MERGLVKIKIWLIVLILEIMLINGWINIDEEFVWMGWIKIILKKKIKVCICYNFKYYFVVLVLILSVVINEVYLF